MSINLATAYNRRVSGFATLRPNPSLSLRTSDTRQTLYDIVWLNIYH